MQDVYLLNFGNYRGPIAFAIQDDRLLYQQLGVSDWTGQGVSVYQHKSGQGVSFGNVQYLDADYDAFSVSLAQQVQVDEAAWNSVRLGTDFYLTSGDKRAFFKAFNNAYSFQ